MNHSFNTKLFNSIRNNPPVPQQGSTGMQGIETQRTSDNMPPVGRE